MKIYIKAIESIDTSNPSFEVGTRWVDIKRRKIFTITKIKDNNIYTDGFNALLSQEDFTNLLINKSVRPTEDYFLVFSSGEFLGYLSRCELVDDENSTKYLLHISKLEVYRHTGMSEKSIQNLIDDLTLYSTNYKYVDEPAILELVDTEISCIEK